MAGKMKIDAKDLREWMEDNWRLYASQSYKGELLRLWTNHGGQYKVVHGAAIVYQGTQITHAIAAWDCV